MSRILLSCLLVAAFQQAIGNSMQGFVMRHQVSWCEGFEFPIRIESQMLSGEDGPPLGTGRTDYYPIPKTEAEQSPVPTSGTSAPIWAP